MDCEKFESALMDELYGELDELTSAATRRHVEGCARCAALLGGLRATRRVATLPRVELPMGLEERILAAAAAAAPNVVPFRSRLARAVSLAGSWAMRPQTAMAAVFLVMIGTSVLLLRGKSSRAPASNYVTVTEEGTPAPAASVQPAVAGFPAAAPPPDPSSASSGSYFATPRPQDRVATGATPTGMFARPPADALDDSHGADGPRRAAAKASVAKGDGEGLGDLALNSAARGAAGGGFAAPAPAAPYPPAAAGAPAGAAAAPPEAEMAPAAAPPSDPGDELWAARAARDVAARQGKACPSGARFDDVASRSPGSQTGWDALYEGALCYESAHDYGSARTRLGTLLGVPSYQYRARITLDRINKEQNGGSASAARAAAPKAGASAPPTTPASPPPAAAPPSASDSSH